MNINIKEKYHHFQFNAVLGTSVDIYLLGLCVIMQICYDLVCAIVAQYLGQARMVE